MTAHDERHTGPSHPAGVPFSRAVALVRARRSSVADRLT